MTTLQSGICTSHLESKLKTALSRPEVITAVLSAIDDEDAGDPI